MEKQSELSPQKNLAVVLIDMQTGFLDEEKELIIPNQIKFLDFCADNNIRVAAFSYIGYGENHPTIQSRLDTMPRPYTKVFEKRKNDAFTRKSFRNWLSKHEIEHLVLMGINACACILATAWTANNEDYKLIMSEDLMSGYCRKNCGHKIAYQNSTTWHENYSSLIEMLSKKTLANSYS